MKKPFILALTSNKGGTGKTTLALGLSAGLARSGYKVLMIDLDQQANMSTGAGCEDPLYHIGSILTEEAAWNVAIVRGKETNLDLIPANANLQRYERNLTGEVGVERMLDELLKDYAFGYDFVVIDCPPNLGVMTLMALTASTHYIVPIQGENFAYRGLDSIRSFVAKIKKNYNPTLQMAGIILNKFRLNTRFGQEVYRLLKEDNEIPIFETKVRQSLPLMECTAEGLSIFEYDPQSSGAQDMENLTKEVISKLVPNGEKARI